MRDFKELADRWNEACQTATVKPNRMILQGVNLLNE
jgi:hypothetical protein